MTSQRKAKRQLDRWHRYFSRYPWHLCTPGILRAYDRRVDAQYAKLRRSA